MLASHCPLDPLASVPSTTKTNLAIHSETTTRNRKLSRLGSYTVVQPRAPLESSMQVRQSSDGPWKSRIDEADATQPVELFTSREAEK